MVFIISQRKGKGGIGEPLSGPQMLFLYDEQIVSGKLLNGSLFHINMHYINCDHNILSNLCLSGGMLPHDATSRDLTLFGNRIRYNFPSSSNVRSIWYAPILLYSIPLESQNLAQNCWTPLKSVRDEDCSASADS